jgi:hypothetical protein
MKKARFFGFLQEAPPTPNRHKLRETATRTRRSTIVGIPLAPAGTVRTGSLPSCRADVLRHNPLPPTDSFYCAISPPDLPLVCSAAAEFAGEFFGVSRGFKRLENRYAKYSCSTKAAVIASTTSAPATVKFDGEVGGVGAELVFGTTTTDVGGAAWK